MEQVINLLDSGKRHGYQLTLLACIVNQTHRLAISMPTEEALDGMPISQLSTLGFLYFMRQKDIYQRDLENFFKLRRSTVSSQLNTLEKKGLIQRVAVSHDARLKKLVLTQQGLQTGEEVLKNLWKINELVIQGLSQREVETLTELLEKIEKNLSQTTL